MYRHGVYRFLVSRQWVILTLVGLVLIPVMIKLGFWQLHRHESRVAKNDLIAGNLDAPTVPIQRLSTPGAHIPRADTWRKVSAKGTYDTRHEVVVRQRTGSDDQTIGYFVVTPLLVEGGDAVLVNRGWIPSGDDITKFPEVPPAPTGTVTVTGRLRADETTANSGIKDRSHMPDRQVLLINSQRQAEDVGRPLLGGYLEMTSSSPAGKHQPEPVAAPDHSGIGPHMAYAVQWWLFAACVPVGWVILVRRERHDRAAEAAKAATGSAATDPDGEDRPGGPNAAESPATASAGTAVTSTD